MMTVLGYLDLILFVVCTLNVAYLLVFAVASLFRGSKSTYCDGSRAGALRRIVCMLPAYKEDAVIVESAKAALSQDYDRAYYDVVVISDKMSERTDDLLREMGAKVFVASYEQSTKSKALNLAFGELPSGYYDIAVILDADNIVTADFLTQINLAFDNAAYSAFQAHRVAKNVNTSMAYLDALSEEINNSIFRRGHVNLGFSSALIGSGMAFEYDKIKYELSKMTAIGGFDRELEFRFFSQGLRIGYIDELFVYDEKVASYDNFSNQRRRWMSAQLHYLRAFSPRFFGELFKGHFDFCDKLVQHLILPRVLLIGVLFVISVLMVFVDASSSVKWFSLFVVNVLVMLISVPKKLYTKQLFSAVVRIPMTFMIMFVNVFKLRGANKKFIHTSHGVENDNNKKV